MASKQEIDSSLQEAQKATERELIRCTPHPTFKRILDNQLVIMEALRAGLDKTIGTRSPGWEPGQAVTIDESVTTVVGTREPVEGGRGFDLCLICLMAKWHEGQLRGCKCSTIPLDTCISKNYKLWRLDDYLSNKEKKAAERNED